MLRHTFLATALIGLIGASQYALGSDEADRIEPAVLRFFETEVRPLLAENCFDCHSARSDKLKGGLRLDSRETILAGGDSGPAVVAGKPDESLLMEAVRYQGLEMPPERRLSANDVAKLEKWIRLGAPFPGGDGATESPRREEFQITDEDRSYWAYQPIVRPAVPRVASAEWNRNPIDAFIAAKLAANGLQPSPPASPRHFVRRIYFGVIGLPPSPEQVDVFERGPSEAALTELVDHLLSLPQYGERWGRHWLDVVRFAQTNGYERDAEKPFVWRYRDYVIDAFNKDKPFDRFIVEQIAGDELPAADAESVVATGFYRLGVWDDEPDDKRAAEFDGLDDILSTMGQVFLGQTLGCARCHDHMFDPISQTDYYEMISFIRNVRHYEQPRYEFDSPTYAPLASPSDVAAFLTQRQERTAALESRRKNAQTDEARKKLDEQIKRVKADKGAFEGWALAVREHGPHAKETHVLIRGNAGTPGAQVQPRFLNVLGNEDATPSDSMHGMSCGLRTQLAHWIASPDNPLTARVIANRVWQHHFGRGIVRTPNDLGKAGLPPTHPELLDWLASELIENDWSLKHLHKKILLSRAYRMSSYTEEGPAANLDPDNNLLWRQNLRRLDAEAIRDSMLFVSGRLNPKMGGRGIFPDLSGEVLASQSRPGWGWDSSRSDEQDRRSIYIFTKRGVRDPLLETFDYVNTTSPLGVRPVTTVAPQALVLLNGRFVQRQAFALAERICQDVGNQRQVSIERLYRLTLGRSPTRGELEIAGNYLERQEQQIADLESVITFRPDVPTALQEDYRKLLKPQDYILGPRGSWSYHRGKWVGGYETIDALDDERVPFVLWDGVTLPVGEVRGKLMLHKAIKFGSLLIHGTANNDLFAGREIRLDPRNRQLVILDHGKDVIKVASVEVPLETSQWIPFRLAVNDEHMRFWLDDRTAPLIEVTNHEHAAGRFGVAVSRGAMSFDDLVVQTAGQEFDVARHNAKIVPAALKAFQSLCVVLMNTNEFVYVD